MCVCLCGSFLPSHQQQSSKEKTHLVTDRVLIWTLYITLYICKQTEEKKELDWVENWSLRKTKTYRGTSVKLHISVFTGVVDEDFSWGTVVWSWSLLTILHRCHLTKPDFFLKWGTICTQLLTSVWSQLTHPSHCQWSVFLVMYLSF